MSTQKEKMIFVTGEPKAQKALSALFGKHFKVEFAPSRDLAASLAGKDTANCAAVFADLALPQSGDEGALAEFTARGAADGGEAVLAKLRALSDAARELTKDKQAEVERLLAEAGGVHAQVVELLHGRVGELLAGKLDCERRLEDSQSALAAKDRDLADAQRELSAAKASLSEAQLKASEAQAEKDKVRERLTADLERAQAKFAQSQAAAQKEKEDLSRQVKTLQSELGNTSFLAEQLQGEKETFAARLDALSKDKQNLEKEAARLGEELAVQTGVLKKELEEAARTRDEALAAKSEADAKMAKIQQQWERIMKG
jgi:chromosome segregation ATPase